MLRTTLSLGGTLLVAAALVFLTPGASHARGGGFHGGGFHGGGFHGGGFHGGGFHSGFHGGFHGGWGGYRPYYGGYHYGWRGYYPYYGGYSGYYPYYGPNYYYNSYPYDDDSGVSYDPGYSNDDSQPALSSDTAAFGGPSPSTDQPSSASTSPADDTTASLTVNVPADARLWIEGTPTTSTGPVREFNSPPLTPGNRYTYDIKASWQENGKEVTQAQQVRVTAGTHVNVNFPVPPRTPGQAPAATGG